MKKHNFLALVLAIVTFVGVSVAQTTTAPAKEKKKKEKKEKVAGPDIIIHTTQGDIAIRLFVDKVPCTASNFVSLCEKHFFDSTLFHRVIPSFMIQGGDPNSKGAGPGKMLGSGGPGYTFADEFDPTLKHDRKGLLSMANSGPATNGSQFFITAVPTPWLDGKHAIFGEVVAGFDVLDKIINAKRDGNNRPYENQVITSVEIIKVKKLKKRIEAAKKAQKKNCPTTPFTKYN